MELRRHIWSAALQLAVVISVSAAVLAIALSSFGEVPQAAVVLPVIVVAFVASWIRTGQIRRQFPDSVRVAPRPSVPVA